MWRTRLPAGLFLAAGAAACPASAQSEPASAAKVVVTGSQSDTAARRDFVAGKIIISRKRIEESGTDNVADLLKREPAVSISADGRIGLMGMPGYTQVLVDGAPPPPGKGLSQMNLVHVEKIEIVKSSVAEFGPFGIAGTINIVTRQAERKTSTRLSAGARSVDGHAGANASLSHNESRAGSPLRWNATMSASQGRTPSERRFSLTTQAPGTAPQPVWNGSSSGLGKDTMADGNAEVAWDAGTGHTLRISPNGGRMATDHDSVETRRYANGAVTTAAIATRSVLTMENLPMNWTFKPDRTSQFDVRAGLSRIRMELSEARHETGQFGPRASELQREAESRTVSLELTYKAKLAKGHDSKMGASMRRIGEGIDYDNRVNGAADTAFGFLGTQRQSLVRQLRLYAQDDWRVNESLALNAGLSGQQTSIELEEGPFSSRPRYRMWSPSFHVTKNLGEDDEDEDNARQLRLSLARTFRPPDRDDLSLRPVIHPLAPCSSSGLCGANTIDTLDSAGNPNLKPERALGLNLAYEHGLGKDSTVTLEVYARRIDNKIGNDIRLADVPWSGVPRYVVRPANLGEATVHGVDLEMEVAVRDLSRTAPNVNVRGSLNFARSRIASLPGPDNRIDKQTPWSAKLGGSYAMKDTPLRVSVDASWSPGVWVRSNLSQRVAVPRRFDLDASANWTFDGGMRLVLSASNLAPRTARHIYEYETAGSQLRMTSDAKRYRTLSVRLESAL